MEPSHWDSVEDLEKFLNISPEIMNYIFGRYVGFKMEEKVLHNINHELMTYFTKLQNENIIIKCFSGNKWRFDGGNKYY